MFTPYLLSWFALFLCTTNAFFLSNANDDACPASCECVTIFNLQEVDCHGLTTVPSGIPSNTRILDLRLCDLTSVHVDQLINVTDLQMFTFREALNDEEFYNLTTLQLQNLFQINIVDSPLSSVPQLLPSYIIELSLVNTSLKTLRSGSFQNYQKLKMITLWNCQLVHIESGAFDDLPALISLDLHDNKLVDDSFSPHMFQENRVLQSVILNSNTLTHVVTTLPDSLTAVDYFNNSISTLQSWAFKFTPNLTTIGLQQNNIKTIQDYAFDGLLKAKEVDLSHNEIDRVSNYSFSGLTGVTKLNIRDNNIKNLGKEAFSPFISLRELIIDDNQIAAIEDFTFQTMASLVTIDLTNNKLVQINNNTFTGLHSLQEMDITGNVIQNIESEAFVSLKSLKFLRIINNRLERLQPEVLNNVPAGTTVYLGGLNPWRCDCHLRWLREAVDNATYHILYPNAMRCATPMKLAGKYFSDLNPSDFVCT